MQSKSYEDRVNELLDALGIARDRRLPLQFEARELTVAEIDGNGIAHFLVPEAAAEWVRMKRAAADDCIALEIVSAFRSIEEQVEIIREKLDRAMPMEIILTLSAPPGYSEHHTGCAIDINTPGCLAREAPFEHTEAFRWLAANAHRYCYTLSYPRDNPLGFIYEPWHWYYRAPK